MQVSLIQLYPCTMADSQVRVGSWFLAHKHNLPFPLAQRYSVPSQYRCGFLLFKEETGKNEENIKRLEVKLLVSSSLGSAEVSKETKMSLSDFKQLL